VGNRTLLVCLSITLSVFAFCGPQKPAPYTPGKAEVAAHQPNLEPPAGPQLQKLDPAKLRQEGDELSSLAQSLPADIAQAVQGRLPKTMADKLKRIEKLSKHLRSELSL
jgi:hypothetical protein